MTMFQIDHNKISSILEGAHASLMRRCDQVIEESAAIPEKHQTDQDLEHARDVALELNEAKTAARNARLLDQKPFKVASATVQEFFNNIERPLGRTENRPGPNCRCGSQPPIKFPRRPPTSPDTLGRGAGVAIVVTNPPLAAILGAEIELVWSVRSVDRAAWISRTSGII